MIEKVINKDLLVKVAAVILALLVWVVVINDKNPLERRILTVGIDTVELSSGQKVLSLTPEVISVTLEGRSRNLSLVESDKVMGQVDLSGLLAGQNTCSVEMTIPSGVKVIDVNPKTIIVDIDDVVEKDVDVNVHLIGSPHEDFEAESPEISLETAVITGAKRYVDMVQWVIAEVDITGARQGVRSSVKLVPRDSQGNEIWEVAVEPEEISITVPMTELPPSKTVRVDPITSGVPKAGFRLGQVTVTPGEIKLRAETWAAPSINLLKTGTIDITERTGTFTQTVNVLIPSGVTWIQTAQVTVRVEIEEDIINETFDGVTVIPQMVSPGLRFSIDPPTVSVTLRGRSDRLAGITKNNIEAYVDMQGYLEGEYDMTLHIKMPEGVELYSVTPQRATVILQNR